MKCKGRRHLCGMNFDLEDWRQEVRARMEEEHQVMTACGGMGE